MTEPEGHETASVAVELARTPLVKDLLRTWIRALEGPGARTTLREALLADPETALSLLAATPAVVNLLAGSLLEAGRALEGKASAAVTRTVLEGLWAELDRETLRECWRVWSRQAAELHLASPEAQAALARLVATRGADEVGRGLDALVRAINAAERRSPGATRRVVRRALGRVDRHELEAAAKTVAEALVEEARAGLVSGAWSAVTSTVRRNLGERAASLRDGLALPSLPGLRRRRDR